MKVCIILALVACVAALAPHDFKEEFKAVMKAEFNLPAELLALFENDPMFEAMLNNIDPKFFLENPQASFAERCGFTGTAPNFAALFQAIQALISNLTPATTVAPTTTVAPPPAPGRR